MDGFSLAIFRLKRRSTRWILIGTGLFLIWGVLMGPSTTRQGINFKVSTWETPRYVKALAFFYRHFEYDALAKRITGGLSPDQERVQAIFHWTVENIRPTPKGWVVVDDHILNIIIRRYGLDDQMADVFTTLSTYAGIPAFWRVVSSSESDRKIILSFAKVDRQWRVFDVANGKIFQNSHGELASIEELKAHPSLANQTWEGKSMPQEFSYEGYFEEFGLLKPPGILRAEKQMPIRRLWYQAGRVFDHNGSDGAD